MFIVLFNINILDFIQMRAPVYGPCHFLHDFHAF